MGMELRQKALLDAQSTIKLLEDQLKETQAAKEELEARQQELHEMMQRLEESKNMEAEERVRLEEEIRMKQEEVSTIYQQVRTKEDDNDNHLTNGDTSRDLRMDSDEIVDPVDERQTLAERNLRLQDQLRSLKEDLSHIRDDTGETTMDRIHKKR